METIINRILAEAQSAVAAIATEAHLQESRNRYLSKKSELMGLFAQMRDVPAELKAAYGQLINQARTQIEAWLETKRVALEKEALRIRYEAEKIDITLPGSSEEPGVRNPFYIVKDDIISILIALGYQVVEGPEVESDHYNFELMNIPKDHPARDMQDTFYIDPVRLLRTHTSPVQARTMEQSSGHPIRMICPGKVYRRDDDDATHSHQFAQIEGLLVDKDINLGHLQATLDKFIKKLFGPKREIRFRSSYFPFTEPSVEVDVSCSECGGKGCSMCKGTGWIEILGAGMVHPNVLKMSGYDPAVWSGFAFGVGIERVAMLRYGIDDIRRIYQNDIRFIKQFVKG
ncbi:MAG: phenylalanine--tRNA ligase subunit alpha [Bacilli bacterium]|jgi:phenylalanyl-tRNA synthetase alpha chain